MTASAPEATLTFSPDIVREMCDEARASSAGRIEHFYRNLADSLNRRLATAPADVATFAVILVSKEGGIRAVLDSTGSRFIEPTTAHEDRGTGAISLWFSPHHEQAINPFDSRESAERASKKVVAVIGQAGVADRLRVVPAESRKEKELCVHMAAAPKEKAKQPDQYLSTQVFQAYVDPARPRHG